MAEPYHSSLPPHIHDPDIAEIISPREIEMFPLTLRFSCLVGAGGVVARTQPRLVAARSARDSPPHGSRLSSMPIVIAALLLTLAAGSAHAGPLTETERQRLLTHLEMTERWLIDEVTDLSPAQLVFRTAPQSWSILEVVEHLVVVGPIYWQDLQRAVKAAPSRQASTWGDADILWYGIDRTRRDGAVPAEEPTRQLRDLKTGLEAFRKAHAQLAQYIRSTEDDLRSRIVPRQGCDAYQWALMISTHEQRHILQIRDIKASPGFPRKP